MQMIAAIQSRRMEQPTWQLDRSLEDDVAARKRAAACAAVAEIEDGMLVGLGTGTTANFAIAALGERVAAGLKVTTVATSLAAARAAEAAGLAVLPFDTLARLDLAIDGADELDPQLRAIKGKGGAMLREKIVAAAATRMIVDRRRGQAGDRARHGAASSRGTAVRGAFRF